MTGDKQKSRLVPLSEKGRVIGQDHWRAKLTDAQVEEIRVLHEAGELGYRRLAKQFKVSRSTIQHVVTHYRRNAWPERYVRVDK